MNGKRNGKKERLNACSQWKLLHWRTDRYLINLYSSCLFHSERDLTTIFHCWRQKKRARYLVPFRQSKWKHKSMKANLSQKALKLGPNDNCFTEELVGILWTEFKLFISNWSKFDLYFPLLKPKKGLFFLSESKSQSKFGPEVRSQWKLLHWGTGNLLPSQQPSNNAWHQIRFCTRFLEKYCPMHSSIKLLVGPNCYKLEVHNHRNDWILASNKETIDTDARFVLRTQKPATWKVLAGITSYGSKPSLLFIEEGVKIYLKV